MANTSSLVVIFCLLAVSTTMSAALEGGRRKETQDMGKYEAIKDLENPHVVEIAKFAVNQHNTKSGEHLEYAYIVKGEQKVVIGMYYRLVILVKVPDAPSKTYEAVVYERDWQHLRKLESFKPVCLDHC